MKSKVLFCLVIILSAVALAACTPQRPASRATAPSSPALSGGAGMANPAAVYCGEHGGQSITRQDASGGQVGICVFPDNSECDEWAYFRGECKPGEAQAAATALPSARTRDAASDPAAETASDGWKIYRSAALGCRFDYPPDATIEMNDDPLKGVAIVGPLQGDEKWPQITLSQAGDREDERPPEGADLAQWLADHSLLDPQGADRQPDAQIAGATAVHTRHERSPQFSASDRYFFTHAGRLYTIVIVHAGGREDWTLYNRFLTSIQFEEN